MRLLFLMAIVLAVGFYVYTYKYLPSTTPPPPPPAPVEAGPVTMAEIDALANAIGLTALNTQALREPVEIKANPALLARANALLERPNSNLTKSWLRNFVAMQELAAESPGANVRADIGQLYRNWQALRKLYEEQKKTQTAP